jgi:uncharacterized protein YkwD
LRTLRGTLGSFIKASPMLVASMLLAQAGSQNGNPATIPPEAEQIVQLVDHARAEAGAGALQWDTALAEAARQHCLRMAAEESIEDQFDGEPTLTERANHAGAHFNLIAESAATGSVPAEIYGEWMNSPEDRSNLLNQQMDRIGVAFIPSHGTLYIVADVERAVPLLTQVQVEAAIEGLLRRSGITVLHDATAARAVCATDRPLSRDEAGRHPGFVLRWQESDLTRLPDALTTQIKSPLYSQAEVGSCAPQDVKGAFTTYRVAVLLY